MAASIQTAPLLSTRNLLAFAGWTLALFGTLQVHNLEGQLGHAICGPWGCGPPVSALVGYHAFWCLLIFPVALILGGRMCGVTRRHLGTGLVLVSVAGIAALLLLEGLDNSAAEAYPLRWCLFRVATFVDFPLAQLGIAGIWLRRGPTAAAACENDEIRECDDEQRSAHEAGNL